MNTATGLEIAWDAYNRARACAEAGKVHPNAALWMDAARRALEDGRYSDAVRHVVRASWCMGYYDKDKRATGKEE